MEKFKAVVMRASGTNCDCETANALRAVGFDAELAHINEFARKEKLLRDYSLLAIPGGFSYGDYLGSGKVFANKLVYSLGNSVPEFVDRGGLVIGICNGFQVLVKAGLLPALGSGREQEVTLTFNSSGSFQCEWVKLKKVGGRRCVFARGLGLELHMPIAHGEGRFVPRDEKALRKLYENDCVVFKYVKNPNGSVDDIAGICDRTGRVLGMMPHPERNFFSINDPRSLRAEMPDEGDGAGIFRNAVEYLKGKSIVDCAD